MEDSHFDIDVITGAVGNRVNDRTGQKAVGYEHNHLAANGADLNFDIYDAERLCANVDLDETWVHRFVELSEP